MKLQYMKNETLGNAYFPADQVEARLAEGWCSWPRTREQKLNQLATIAGVANRVTPSLDRAGLLAEAEAIGLKVDGRWSDARLAEELAKA